MKIFILVFLLLISNPISAQLSLPHNLPTPNTASMGKYGGMKVSSYSGTVAVSIPLYSMSIRDVPMSISLTYDTSGFLVNTLPSWTGYNWTLQAGGVITRTVLGVPDEYRWTRQHYYNTSTCVRRQCYFKDPGILERSKRSGFSNIYDYYYWSSSSSWKLMPDLQPDIFTFHFMGKTGRFFLDNDARWRVCGDDNLEIVYDINDSINNLTLPFIEDYPRGDTFDKKQPKVIKGFTIRDENGTIYKFGWNPNAIEYSTNLLQMGDREDMESWHANAWYLTSVEDKFGNLLYSLEYERGKFIVQLHYSKELTRASAAGYSLTNKFSTSPSDISFDYAAEVSSPVYLKKICASNGVEMCFSSTDSPLDPYSFYTGIGIMSVEKFVSSNYHFEPFYYLQNPKFKQYQYASGKDKGVYPLSSCRIRKLDMITIGQNFPGNSTPGKAYRLYYSYDGRMHLNNIRIQDGSYHFTNSIGWITAYRFKYHSIDKLPSSYSSMNTDHWGYYNGGYGYPTSEDIMQKQKPDERFSKLGMLTKICYPTGGCTVLEYEANTFSKYRNCKRNRMVDSTGLGGGLRIRSLTEYEDTLLLKVIGKVRYEYNIPGTQRSSGELFSAPIYLWKNWAPTIERPKGQCYTTFRRTSIIPLSNSFGNHIGYTYVTEVRADGSKKIYHYSNISTETDQGPLVATNLPGTTPFSSFSERNFMLGKLLCLTSYDNCGRKVKSEGYQYEFSHNKEAYVLTSDMKWRTMDNPLAFEDIVVTKNRNYLIFSKFRCLVGSVYKLFYGRANLISKTDTLFHDNGNYAEKTTYRYQTEEIASDWGYNHMFSLNLLNSEERTVKSDSYKILYGYGPLTDTKASNIDPVTNLYNTMSVFIPVTVKKLRNGKFLSLDSTAYRKITVNGKRYSAPSAVYERNRGGENRMKVAYEGYTNTGALKSYRQLGSRTIFLEWAYNDNYLLMASTAKPYFPTIKNDLLFQEDILLKNLDSYLKMLSGQSGIDFTFYTYSPVVGITSIISSNGTRTKYVYDNFCRLTDIIDNNGSTIKHFDYEYSVK